MYAFRWCTSIVEATINSNVIENHVFEDDTCLTKVTIGSNVNTIKLGVFSGCLALRNIYCMAKSAPSVSSSTFGDSTSNYTGRNTYNTGENMFYVPVGATGYNTSYWNNPLQNSDKCGFTISYTL